MGYYCRFDDVEDDVCFYRFDDGSFKCTSCSITPRTVDGSDFYCDTPEQALEHLTKHAKQGDEFPFGAVVRLREEIAKKENS